MIFCVSERIITNCDTLLLLEFFDELGGVGYALQWQRGRMNTDVR
jgi:hypothetical protein